MVRHAFVGAVAAFLCATAAADTQVFFSDFDSGAPAELSGYFSLESVSGLDGMKAATGTSAFGGNLLRNDATGNPAAATVITLTDLPLHTHLSLSFLLVAIDSWDSTDGSPAPDIFRIEVGDDYYFETTFAIGSGSVNYANLLATVYEGGSSLGWGGYAEKAYDVSFDPTLKNIPHTGDSVTIRIFARGVGWQGGIDESWGIDNFSVTATYVPAPGAMALLGLGGLVTGRRRR